MMINPIVERIQHQLVQTNPRLVTPLKTNSSAPENTSILKGLNGWLAEKNKVHYPSKIEWDLTNGPLSKLLELLDTQV